MKRRGLAPKYCKHSVSVCVNTVLRNHISLTVYRFRFFQLLCRQTACNPCFPTVICQHKFLSPEIIIGLHHCLRLTDKRIFICRSTDIFDPLSHHSSTVSQRDHNLRTSVACPSCSLLIFFLCQHGKSVSVSSVYHYIHILKPSVLTVFHDISVKIQLLHLRH